MFRKIKIKNRNEILALIFLIILTATFTSYHNYTQEKIKNNYNEIINNLYFKKTTDHFLNKLEPKFKKIRHQIIEGETFDNILNKYEIDKKEIQNLKNKLSKKINLNKLNTNQKIYLTIDQVVYNMFEFKKQYQSTIRKVIKGKKDKYVGHYINNFNASKDDYF